MDSLKEILGMVKDLPAATLWVLAGYLFYKLSVIGSIYGLIRFVVKSIADYLSKRIENKVFSFKEITSGLIFYSTDIGGISTQISRLVGKGEMKGSYRSDRITDESIRWLKAAIDMKEAKDREEDLKKQQKID